MCTCFLIFGFETKKGFILTIKIQTQIKSKLSICTKQFAV